MAKDTKAKIVKVEPPSTVRHIPMFFDEAKKACTGPAFVKKEDAEKWIRERTENHEEARIVIVDLADE